MKGCLFYYSRERSLEKELLKMDFYFNKNIKNSLKVSTNFLKTSFKHGLHWSYFVENILLKNAFWA